MLDAVSEPQSQTDPQIILSSGRTRRVAAIDIGTNSTHLLVASVDTTLRTFSIEQAEKSTTRLGERDPETGELTAAAMQRSYDTLRRFRDLANSHQVEQIVTAATSDNIIHRIGEDLIIDGIAHCCQRVETRHVKRLDIRRQGRIRN